MGNQNASKMHANSSCPQSTASDQIKPPYAISPSESFPNLRLETKSDKLTSATLSTEKKGSVDQLYNKSQSALSRRCNNIGDGSLQLEVPEIIDEPLLGSMKYHFSPCLNQHTAVPVPEKILHERAAFQSPITNNLSGPFRISSSLNLYSPIQKRALYNKSLGSGMEVSLSGSYIRTTNIQKS